LEAKVAEHEKYEERVSERLNVKEEIEAFSTQELTKVKHLVCVVACGISSLRLQHPSDASKLCSCLLWQYFF